METMEAEARFVCTLAPEGRQFPTGGQASLLSTALAAGLAVPFSCQRGECGSCRAHVVAGRYERIAPPSPNGYETGEQELLLCQCRALSDLTLRFPHWSAPPQPAARRTARVASLQFLSRTIVRLVVTVEGDAPFAWHAGQHVQVLSEAGSPRCFSIANLPAESADGRRLEFQIRRIPGGAFTDRLLGSLAPGDTLQIEGPYGTCVWTNAAETDADELVLVATGTGFAGVRPILVSALASGAYKAISLYWGNREAHDCHASAWLTQLQSESPCFRWRPVLSAESADPVRVQDLALAHRHDWPRAQVYACGHPAMVRDARQAFLSAGLPRERFLAEAFVPAEPPRPQPRHPWERVGPRFSMQGMLEARRRSIDAVNAVATMLRPGMRTAEAVAMIDAHLRAMGAAYNWHPTYVRFGPDTLNTWHRPADRERRLQADDIAVIDIGPVWDGHEGDYGDTFALSGDPDHQRCAQAARAVFDLARQAWLGGMTGQALYEHAETLAQDFGCELVPEVPGHRVSEFPHALHGKHRLSDADFVPDHGIWVLEIQVRDRVRPIGAFFEDVLLRD